MKLFYRQGLCKDWIVIQTETVNCFTDRDCVNTRMLYRPELSDSRTVVCTVCNCAQLGLLHILEQCIVGIPIQNGTLHMSGCYAYWDCARLVIYTGTVPG